MFAALVLATRPGFDTEIHLGRTIPLHIPTQTVYSNDTFEVPVWLGAFYATVPVATEWILPLTIGNGGQTYPGEFLIIRNYGPKDITITPTSPETIEGSSQYLIPADTVVEILSGYPNWAIISASSSSQAGQWIYMYRGTNTAPAETPDVFTVQIGLDTDNPPPNMICDNNVSGSCVGWDGVNIGRGAGKNSAAQNLTNIGTGAGAETTGNNGVNIGNRAGANSRGGNTVNIGTNAGENNTAGACVIVGSGAGRRNIRNNAIFIGVSTGADNTGANAICAGASSCEFNTGDHTYAVGVGGC